MEVVRKTVNSNLLDKLSLPQSQRNRQAEVIVLPVVEGTSNNEKMYTIDDFVGVFEKYKNPDLIPLEKSAWSEAVVEKHGNN
jgi:hypothetical protein